MIAKKLLVPPNLTKTQAFCVYKMAKIVVIGKNKDFALATF